MIQWRTRKIAQLVKLGMIVINAPEFEQREILRSLNMDMACVGITSDRCSQCQLKLNRKNMKCLNLFSFSFYPPDGETQRRIISFKQFQNWALKPNKK